MNYVTDDSIADLETAVNRNLRTVLVTANGKTRTVELRPQDDVFWRQECAGGWSFEVSRSGQVSHYRTGQGWGG